MYQTLQNEFLHLTTSYPNTFSINMHDSKQNEFLPFTQNTFYFRMLTSKQRLLFRHLISNNNNNNNNNNRWSLRSLRRCRVPEATPSLSLGKPRPPPYRPFSNYQE